MLFQVHIHHEPQQEQKYLNFLQLINNPFNCSISKIAAIKSTASAFKELIDISYIHQ